MLIEIQYPSRQHGLLAFSTELPSSSSAFFSSSSSTYSFSSSPTTLVCPPTLPKWVFNLKVSALTFFKHRLDKVPLANKWINGEINNAASRLHSLTSRTAMHTSTQGEIDKQRYWGISWGLCLAQCDGWFICSLQEVVNQCLPSGQLGSRHPGNLLSVIPEPCRFRRLYAYVCAFSCLPPKMMFSN